MKLLFPPPNVTSRLQPLDQGIIRALSSNIEVWCSAGYWRERRSAADLTKSINVLETLRWVRQAWGKAQAGTIIKCFRHCGRASDDAGAGMLGSDEDVIMDEGAADLAARADVVDSCFEEEVDCFEHIEEPDAKADPPDVFEIDGTDEDDETVELEDEEEKEPPSPDEALRAIETLKTFALA